MAHLASWAITATGPLAWAHICGIIISPWICYQLDNFGSRSGYLAISILWSDASFKARPHASGYLDLLQAVANLLLRWSASSRWYTRLMMYSIYIDESITYVNCCTAVTSVVCLFLKSWTVYLTVWITGARCMVLEATPLSGCAGIESMPIIVAVRLSDITFQT
jgi:hypothetical protein